MSTLQEKIEERREKEEFLKSRGIIDGNGKLVAYYLAKYMEEEYNSICMPGRLIYCYNGRIYNLLDENIFISKAASVLEFDEYRMLLKGTKRRELVDFLSDTTLGNSLKSIDEKISDNKRYLTLNNCLLDLETMGVSAHTPNIFTTNLLNYDYDPDASTEKFEIYVKSLFENSKEMVYYVQEVMGYVLYKGMPVHSVFFLIGEAGTGKSALTKIVKAMLGEDNIVTLNVSQIRDEKYLITLKDKLLNVSDEFGDSYIAPKSVETLKAISANGDVTGRVIYNQPITFKSYAKLFFSMNDFPTFIDNTFALFDRIYVIKFEKNFRNTNSEIMEIEKQFMGKGMSGVLNFALQGLRRLKSRDFRFSVPRKMITEKESYKLQNNNVWAFFSDCMAPKRGARIRIKDAYEAYEKYVKENYKTLKTCVKRHKFTSMLESTFGVKIINPQGYKTILDYTLADEENIEPGFKYSADPDELSDDELLKQIVSA